MENDRENRSSKSAAHPLETLMDVVRVDHSRPSMDKCDGRERVSR